MEKKLPSVFANRQERKIDRSQELFYSKGEVIVEKDDTPVSIKINRIFNSPNHVYKSKVFITTAEGTVEETIVGKTNNSLLTIDKKLISISKISDIKRI